MAKRTNKIALLLVATLGAGTALAAEEGEFVLDLATLSFREFERIAIEADPVSAAAHQRGEAARHRAVSMSQLPDPQVRMGFINVPVDSFSLSEEDMTMKEIGFQQSFPPYGNLTHSRAEQEAMASAEDAMGAERELSVLRGVREAWLELYFQFQAVSLIQRTQQVFDELVKVTTARYRSGRGKQQDVVRSELELSKLRDRVAIMESEKDVLMTELGRWIGASHLARPAPVKFPDLPPLPSLDVMRGKLGEHPMLQAAEAQVEVAREGVELARSDYRPMSMVDVSYGQRGGERSDMMSAMLSFSVPIFTSKRQDRNLQARRADVIASKSETEQRRRELQEMLESDYRRLQRLDERLKLYEKEVLPYSGQYAQSSMTAYQAGVSDFEDQVMARMQELENGMEALRVKVDRAKTQARLLYIYGDRTL